jgi:ankyrin repeat protein
LHLAAPKGHKDLAALLIANRADVNSKNKDGDTPLRMGIQKGHNDVAELLRRMAVMNRICFAYEPDSKKNNQAIFSQNDKMMQICAAALFAYIGNLDTVEFKVRNTVSENGLEVRNSNYCGLYRIDRSAAERQFGLSAFLDKGAFDRYF